MKRLIDVINEMWSDLNTVDDRMGAAGKHWGKSKRTIYSWVASGTHFYIEGKIVEVKA